MISNKKYLLVFFIYFSIAVNYQAKSVEKSVKLRLRLIN